MNRETKIVFTQEAVAGGKDRRREFDRVVTRSLPLQTPRINVGAPQIKDAAWKADNGVSKKRRLALAAVPSGPDAREETSRETASQPLPQPPRLQRTRLVENALVEALFQRRQVSYQLVGRLRGGRLDFGEGAHGLQATRNRGMAIPKR
jgi:hypothetical protein